MVGLVERRLNASARFLGYGGRLEFVKSVLSTLPTFFMCSLKLQKTIINICNRAQRHCLWAKEEDSTSSNALAAWSLVCRPKCHGGLGVLNLELQNKALLLKQLHEFFEKDDTPWVNLVWSLYDPNKPPHAQSKRGSFWWKDIFSFIGDYRSISKCSIGHGSSVLFWKDFWNDSITFSERFPRLYSYARDSDISVNEFAGNDIRTCFALPLSQEAFQEYQEVEAIMSEVHISQAVNDKRTFVWGDKYTPSKFYRFLFEQIPKNEALNAIWNSKALPKLRVFVWLLMIDRLNTRDLMLRKSWHLDSGPNCILCQQDSLEDRDHLFFGCSFAAACWEYLHIAWDMALPITERFTTARSNFAGSFFMEIFACAAWNIWKLRNDFIFRGLPASFARWKIGFQNDTLLHRYRVRSSHVQPLIDWLTSLS